MDALGIPYRAVAPHYDEQHDPALTPTELVRKLALGKAREVASRFPEARVVGSDQVVALEGQVWSKPADATEARGQLAKLSGRTHQIVTGVALVGPGLERVEHEVVEMTMFKLGDEELTRYLATNEWEGCAGSYRIESRGLALFAEVKGDLNTVRGLPMTRLIAMLRDTGVRFFG